jgi:hypothetical protein
MTIRYAIGDAEVEVDDLPRYEKRRRPMRGTFTAPVRRAALQAKRQSSTGSAPKPGSRPSGFHRRIVKKPFYFVDKPPVASSAV